MQVAAWVIGEFSEYLQGESIGSIMDLLCKSLFKSFDDSTTKGWILTALQKISKGVPSDQCRDLISRFSTSRNEDLQQRCYELAGTCTKLPIQLNFRRNFNVRTNFHFLESYVQQELLNGARPYNQNLNRKSVSYVMGKGRPEEYKASEALQSMRIEAYSAPVSEKSMARTVEKPQDAGELHVKNKIWSKEGYAGNSNASQPQPPPVAALQDSIKVYQPSVAKVPMPQTKVLPRSEKDVAREQLAHTLFGSFGPPQEIGFRPPQQAQPIPPQKKIQHDSLLDL
jgi:AP-4 complex subunit epsilon-1